MELESSSAPERFHPLTHERNGPRQIAHKELRLQAEHVVTQPAKLLIPPRVSATGARMNRAIDLHVRPKRGSKEVRDPSPRERHLPAEGNPGLAGGKLHPQPALRDGGKLAKRPSTGAEDRSAMTRECELTHDDSERSAWGRAQHAMAQLACQAWSVSSAERRGAWRARCASLRSLPPRLARGRESAARLLRASATPHTSSSQSEATDLIRQEAQAPHLDAQRIRDPRARAARLAERRRTSRPREHAQEGPPRAQQREHAGRTHDVPTTGEHPQDRLLTYGTWTFTYTANGELETKTNTATGDEWALQYDALGNLLSVGLPNGDLVEYLVDGMGRRVGKKMNGVLLKQWLYGDALRPVAELDGAGSLVAGFVYGSKHNVPEYVLRGGATYRVVSDHLGSPRLVVNDEDSTDVPFSADYGLFGDATGVGLDWMPFGFAGGRYDQDTGFIRFGVRDIDPLTGRWNTREHLRFIDGTNLYRYAGDPINYVDIDGKALGPVVVVVGIGIAVAAWLYEGFSDVRDEANLETVRRYPGPPETRAPGTEADAFRHCLASCVASLRYGKSTTLLVGDTREHFSEEFEGHEPAQCAMDLDNNAVGREIADIVDNELECSDRCKGAAEVGIARSIR